MINKDQLRDLITRVLKGMEHVIPYSADATELLMMIAAHESHLGTYLRQENGPALGLFQIEPATETDLYKNYLGFRPDMEEFVGQYATDSQDVANLEHNLAYQIVIARIQLYRKPGKLPTLPHNMAAYAKEHWNSILGKATVDDYLEAYGTRVL